jgi:hypothetical protein
MLFTTCSLICWIGWAHTDIKDEIIDFASSLIIFMAIIGTASSAAIIMIAIY